MPSTNPTHTVLMGQIERITYTSDETGYTVAKVKVFGRRDLVTVIGAIINPSSGEVIRMQNEYLNIKKLFLVIDQKFMLRSRTKN